jgi:hypothetical protein
MPHRTGWFPARRDDVIHLADAWSGQLDLHGTVWSVPAGRWATAEEAAADPRLLTRPPSQAADLPMHFSTSRKRHELPFSLADIGLEAHVTACWQTPRNQEGPYCPTVPRLIA